MKDVSGTAKSENMSEEGLSGRCRERHSQAQLGQHNTPMGMRETKNPSREPGGQERAQVSAGPWLALKRRQPVADIVKVQPY